MKQILRKVTVTGADDSVDVAELFEIQDLYPFVEFGILISQHVSTGAGANRFPSKDWLSDFADVCNTNQNPPLNLSGHICGHWVREALVGQWPDLETVATGLSKVFQRFQLNTHAEPHKVGLHKLDEVIQARATNNQTIIFQIDGLNNELIDHCRARGHKNIAGLFDLSHGAGALPTEWPKLKEGLNCGYAGGLSPENVAEQMARIEVAAGRETWIDAETHLRSNGDRDFDLDKVVDFLESAKPWVIES